MPEISVIVPVYNTAEYLTRCINSIHSQLLQDIEILCVNDASSDNSLKVLKSFAKKDRRIKIINFKQNKGVAEARNTGIKEAKGRYIAFVDSDDYIEEDFLYKLFKIAEKQDADIVKGSYRYEHDGYIACSLNEKIREHKTNFTFDFCSAIYKKELIKNNNIEFPSNLKDMEDPIFALRCALYANKISTVDDAYINIVKRRESLTYGIPDYDRIQNKFAGLNEFLDLVNENSESMDFDSYVFVTAYWISNCFISCSRNENINCAKMTVQKTFDAVKKIKPNYYPQFKNEFDNFKVNFENYMKRHNLDDILKEYEDYNGKFGLIDAKNEHIPIFLSSDENYAPFVAVTIASICYNTKSFIEFYVLDGGISNFAKKQIELLKSKFNNFSIEFIEINSEEVFKNIDYINVCEHVTISTYNRFLIPSVKPNIKKAIYLDVDAVVLGDIRELYNVDLGEYSLGAVPENISYTALEFTCKRLELSNGHRYFNAGVLLLNCEKLRQDNVLEKLLETEEKNRSICLQADQDVLNIFFDNNYLQLPVKFNYMTNDIMRNVSKLKDIVVRHFNCKEKPWLYDRFENKPLLHFNYFWFFAEMTAFYNGLSQQLQTNMLRNAEYNIKQEIEEIFSKDVDKIKNKFKKTPAQNAILQVIRTRVQKDMSKC